MATASVPSSVTGILALQPRRGRRLRRREGRQAGGHAGHKVSLFHHSSFLGGRDVDAAGELRVEGGKLVHITNKSGHDTPGFDEMAAAPMAMANAGVDLSGAEITVIWPGHYGGKEYPGKAVQFLRDFKQQGAVGVENVLEGRPVR